MSENPIVVLSPSNRFAGSDQFRAYLDIRGWFLGYYTLPYRTNIYEIPGEPSRVVSLPNRIEIHETSEICSTFNRVLIKGYENFENNHEIEDYTIPFVRFKLSYNNQQYTDFFENKQFLFRFDFGSYYRPTKLQIFLYSTYFETRLVEGRGGISILMDCPSPSEQGTPSIFIRLEQPHEVYFFSAAVDLY
ncbi:MAG: hypothetical protein ACFE9S_16485 [Candidatus Hermodarchaeota archaeon]